MTFIFIKFKIIGHNLFGSVFAKIEMHRNLSMCVFDILIAMLVAYLSTVLRHLLLCTCSHPVIKHDSISLTFKKQEKNSKPNDDKKILIILVTFSKFVPNNSIRQWLANIVNTKLNRYQAERIKF